ncbi:MAG: hypothetical protein EOP49_05465 [Sphingobacteriales bacterium]|nr:MAG: hypothetical protein EOP49_05465 [Sphingobacteriales bacterium]
MNRLHAGLTVAVAVKAGLSNALREVLRENNAAPKIIRPDSYLQVTNPGNGLRADMNPMGISLPYSAMKLNPPASELICNFDNSPTTLFVSMVMIPAQHYCGQQLPETLIFATTYWGKLSGHLQDLFDTNGAGLCRIFQHCDGFPDGTLVNKESLISYLKSHRHSGAFNSRYTGYTKADIQQEKEMRAAIEDYLDLLQNTVDLEQYPADQRAIIVKTLVQRHIKAQVDRFRWIREGTRDSPREFMVKNRVIIVSVLSIIISLVVFAIADPASIGWVLSLMLGISIALTISITRNCWKPVIMGLLINPILGFIIRKKQLTAARPPDQKVQAAAASQLRPVINEMTAAAPLKPGFLRRHFYWLALRLVNFGRSQLMNVPTVSSLRWLSIDNKKRLLFLSNYSNTTDFYVREFLTGNTPRGVNFMFSNGCGFPDAEHMTKGGISRDPEGYMHVIHHHQHITDLWYAHDYEITIDQIKRNRKIRNGLFKNMNEKEAKRWLKLF